MKKRKKSLVGFANLLWFDYFKYRYAPYISRRGFRRTVSCPAITENEIWVDARSHKKIKVRITITEL